MKLILKCIIIIIVAVLSYSALMAVTIGEYKKMIFFMILNTIVLTTYEKLNR